MLQTLQKLMSRPGGQDQELAWLDAWAQRRGEVIKRVRGDAGLVIEGQQEGHSVRLEWGPSQRDYMKTRELRLRYELGLPAGLEMLVISRDLAEHLEALTFDDLTRDQQTGIDTQMPEEARWLAMYERVPAEELPAGVNENFVVLGVRPALALHWVDSEVGMRLARASSHWLSPEIPLVLMTLRGRVYLRTEAPTFDEALLDGLRGLGDAAAHQALQVVERPGRDTTEAALFDIDEIL